MTVIATKRLLGAASLLALLFLGAGMEARAAEIPEVPPPTCCGCGATGVRSGSGYSIQHRPGCPYGGGGGGTDAGPSTDSSERNDQISNGECLLVSPVITVVGFFMGGVWNFKQLAGHYGNQGALKSWWKNAGAGSDLPVVNFFAKLGAFPFLVLYPATWALKQVGLGLIWGGEKTVQGVAWLGKKTWQGISWPPKQVYYAFAGRPGEKPKPTVPQLHAAAANYGELRKDATRVLAEAKESREAAAEKRDAFLDELIAGDPELQKVLAAEGREAARARATKRLDAYLSSYRERAKIRGGQQALLAEMNDTIDKADMQVFEDVVALGIDKAGGHFTDKWKARLAGDRLTQVERHGLRLKLNLASVAEATKTGFDAGNDLQDISASLKKAEEGDHDARLEAHEKTGRMIIGFLDRAAPGKIGTVGLNTMDAVYCAAAHLVVGNQAAGLQGEILRTMRPREDALALRWAKNAARVKAAANNERIAGIKLEFYSEMERKYAKDAAGKEGSK